MTSTKSNLMNCSHQLTLCNKFRFLLMTYEVIVSNLAIKREGTGNQIIDTFLWYPSLQLTLRISHGHDMGPGVVFPLSHWRIDKLLQISAESNLQKNKIWNCRLKTVNFWSSYGTHHLVWPLLTRSIPNFGFNPARLHWSKRKEWKPCYRLTLHCPLRQ